MSQVWLLYRVQHIDTQIQDTTKKLEELDAGQVLREEVEALEKTVEETRQNIRKKQVVLRDKDLEVQKITSQKKSFEKKLYSGDSSNPKELAGWQQEMDNLKKQQTSIEDNMLILMEELEEMERLANEQEEAAKGKKEELARAEQSFRESTASFTTELDGLKSKREKIIETLEEGLWKTYLELLENKDGIAIVKILKGNCGGCFMNLPESIVKRVQQRDLEFCNNCGRILYTDGEG